MGWRDWFGVSPTIDVFALELIRLAEKRNSAGWTYDAAQCVLHQGRNGSRVHVANLHREYARAKSSARRDLFEKYLALMTESQREVPRLWELAARAIYPVVRSRYATLSIEIEHRHAMQGSQAVVRWPLFDDICITLVYDYGSQLAHVAQPMAETWGQSLDAVRQRALQNLRALPRPRWEGVDDGVLRLVSDVAYQESFILVDEVFDSLSVPGNPVVAIPNRGVLFAAASNNLAGLDTLIANARESMRSAPWALSGTLLTRTANGWQRFDPPQELTAQAKALEAFSLGITYAEQKAALQKYYGQSGDDVFVANFSLYTSPQNPYSVVSGASWAEGIVSILPRTDMIAFVRAAQGADAEPLVVRWADVERICGYLLRKTDDDPDRYRVESFPTDGAWEHLKRAEVQAE